MKHSFYKIFMCIGIITLATAGCKKDPSVYVLTVNIAPTNGGTVEVSPKQATYEEGTKVTITATPTDGYFFSKWNGDASGNARTIQVTMDSQKNIEVIFEKGFFEDFEDGEAKNFLDDGSGRWSVKNMAYQMTGKGLESSWVYSWYNGNSFSNFEYSVDITVLNNTIPVETGGGIYFRSANGNFRQNSYFFYVDLSGAWSLIRFINGEAVWLKERTSSDKIKTALNQTNTLKVSCSGSTIEVFINGISHGVFTDTKFSAGYNGLCGFDYREGTNAYAFDNFLIKVVE